MSEGAEEEVQAEGAADLSSPAADPRSPAPPEKLIGGLPSPKGGMNSKGDLAAKKLFAENNDDDMGLLDHEQAPAASSSSVHVAASGAAAASSASNGGAAAANSAAAGASSVAAAASSAAAAPSKALGGRGGAAASASSSAAASSAKGTALTSKVNSRNFMPGTSSAFAPIASKFSDPVSPILEDEHENDSPLGLQDSHGWRGVAAHGPARKLQPHGSLVNAAVHPQIFQQFSDDDDSLKRRATIENSEPRGHLRATQQDALPYFEPLAKRRRGNVQVNEGLFGGAAGGLGSEGNSMLGGGSFSAGEEDADGGESGCGD